MPMLSALHTEVAAFVTGVLGGLFGPLCHSHPPKTGCCVFRIKKYICQQAHLLKQEPGSLHAFKAGGPRDQKQILNGFYATFQPAAHESQMGLQYCQPLITGVLSLGLEMGWPSVLA